MTAAWLIGPPLAAVYAVLALRGGALLARSWDRHHPREERR
jgi:hypothetical protein